MSYFQAREHETHGKHYFSVLFRVSVLILTIALSLSSAFALTPQSSKTLNVGFLVLDHVYNSELMAPYDVFHHTRFHKENGEMSVFTVSLDGKDVTTFEGLRLHTDYSLNNAPAIQVLVIPSAEHNMGADLKNEELRQWVRRTAELADYVVTLCDGAFILANTGLLDGKTATTFPTDVVAFRKLFPKIKALEGYSFVRDGKYITSQGGARSYDAAMYLVHHLYGKDVAAAIGAGLVIPWPLPGLRAFGADELK
jgi:transcriptional regulator GlxA family with amidase domain